MQSSVSTDPAQTAREVTKISCSKGTPLPYIYEQTLQEDKEPVNTRRDATGVELELMDQAWNTSAHPEVAKQGCSHARAQIASAVFTICFPAPTAEASKL